VIARCGRFDQLQVTLTLPGGWTCVSKYGETATPGPSSFQWFELRHHSDPSFPTAQCVSV
jgi:hypothetical protein